MAHKIQMDWYINGSSVNVGLHSLHERIITESQITEPYIKQMHCLGASINWITPNVGLSSHIYTDTRYKEIWFTHEYIWRS